MIVFVTNFVSPHTIPLAEKLYERTGGDFLYIETWKMSSERASLGYDKERNKPFVVSYDKYISKKDFYQDVINKANVVFASLGSIDLNILRQRAIDNRMTFLMSERLFKKGFLKLLDIKFWRTIKFINAIKDKNFYLLCMGAYVAKDFKLCGFPKNRMLKFGYTIKDNNDNFEALISQKSTHEIRFLWVGRFIWWKRPFDAIKAFAKLVDNTNLDISLTIVGGGTLQDEIINCIAKYNKKGKIRFLGQKSNEEVRQLMTESHYLLCTSNRLEGWGAVINEGISAGCIVIANKMMGAAPYLIKNEETGYLYTGKTNDLYHVLEKITKSPFSISMARKSFDYLKSDWSADVAADRILDFIFNSKPENIKRGICEYI